MTLLQEKILEYNYTTAKLESLYLTLDSKEKKIVYIKILKTMNAFIDSLNRIHDEQVKKKIK